METGGINRTFKKTECQLQHSSKRIILKMINIYPNLFIARYKRDDTAEGEMVHLRQNMLTKGMLKRNYYKEILARLLS